MSSKRRKRQKNYGENTLKIQLDQRERANNVSQHCFRWFKADFILLTDVLLLPSGTFVELQLREIISLAHTRETIKVFLELIPKAAKFTYFLQIAQKTTFTFKLIKITLVLS